MGSSANRRCRRDCQAGCSVCRPCTALTFDALRRYNPQSCDGPFVNPLRKLWYILTITAASVLVALLIGGIEALGLLGDQLALTGPFWEAVGSLNDSLGYLGFVVVGIFAVCWVASAILYRWQGYDRLETKSG